MYSLENVCASYSGRQVLHNIYLTLPPASFTAIIGPVGSGKSTLLRLLAALHKNYSGSVTLSGKNIFSLPRKTAAQIIAFMPSANTFHPQYPFTVKQIISMARLPFSKLLAPAKIDENIINHSAESLGISHLLNRNILSLSDGQKQLTLLASALAQSTQVILLDEPTSALDPDKAACVFSLLRRLADSGKLIIAAVHDINSVMPYVHGYSALKDGVLLSHGQKLSQKLLYDLYGSEFLPYHNKKGYDLMWRALPK